ncbi:MAG: response regulator transcription factor [Proteobacteria bacterium]|nr:response regulator transcription factor [Pseudomonadota bacterium]
MTRLRAVIADDEPLSLRRLELGLARTPDVEIVGSAQDGAAARDMIRTLRPDLAVLDIKMPGANGVDIVDALQGPDAPQVIFVTAYSRHAVRAFDLNVVDYVLKPLDFDRLADAVGRVRDRLAARDGASRLAELESVLDSLRNEEAEDEDDGGYITELWISERNGRTRVALDTVDWFEAEREYVRIHTRERAYLIRRSIRDLAEHLDPNRFQRLHRSALVNTGRITRIVRRPGGGLVAVLATGVEIPVGRTFQDALRTRLRA